MHTDMVRSTFLIAFACHAQCFLKDGQWLGGDCSVS